MIDWESGSLLNVSIWQYRREGPAERSSLVLCMKEVDNDISSRAMIYG